MFENIGYKTLLWGILIQLWDKWSKYLSKKWLKCFSERKKTGYQAAVVGNPFSSNSPIAIVPYELQVEFLQMILQYVLKLLSSENSWRSSSV